jgi:hypothetical protein
MQKHEFIRMPIGILQDVSEDGDELLKFIQRQDDELLPTGKIDVTDGHDLVIRSFYKNEVPNIPIWLKTHLSLHGRD